MSRESTIGCGLLSKNTPHGEDFLTGSDFGVSGKEADEFPTWGEMFGDTAIAGTGVRSAFRNFLVALTVLVACPGDDVVAVSASTALPINGGLEMPVDPNQLVGVLWVNRRLDETISVLEESGLQGSIA